MEQRKMTWDEVVYEWGKAKAEIKCLTAKNKQQREGLEKIIYDSQNMIVEDISGYRYPSGFDHGMEHCEEIARSALYGISDGE